MRRRGAGRLNRFAPWLFLSLLSAAPPSGAERTANFDWFDYRGNDKLPAPAKHEYRNPILQGFYPDPSITRVGADYYLVNSTFAWFPGIPVFHSRDLVHWTQIGHAIDRPTQLNFGRLGLSRGVFAPAIEHHAGTFYIINTCVDCGGNFVITARDPKGPWSNPVWLPDIVGGIDPSLFFDGDGSAWIVNNGPPSGEPHYEGHRAIWLQRFDPANRRMVGPRTVLIDGGVRPETKPIWIEGPHLFRREGWYYLTAAEGGTAEAHSQVVLRSREVTGPYQPFAGNPILTQRDLPRDRAQPITSAGHADFVETPVGEWWATFLAVRPYQGDYYNTGRETFLMPVRWQEGWPRITDPGQEVPWTARRPTAPRSSLLSVPTSGPFRFRDEFDGRQLPMHWAMMRNPRHRWWGLSSGELRLKPRNVSLSAFANPSFMARRQQHLSATATTSMRFLPLHEGAEAGLAALQNDEFWYLLTVAQVGGKRVLQVKRRAGSADPAEGTVLRRVPMPLTASRPIQLRIAARGAEYDFSWSADGRHWTWLLRGADGTILSTRTAGGFVGTMLGPYAYDPQATGD